MGEKSAQMVYTYTMTKRHAVMMSESVYKKLCEIACSVGCTVESGPHAGEPSPATLMLEIARGSVECYTLDVPS